MSYKTILKSRSFTAGLISIAMVFSTPFSLNLRPAFAEENPESTTSTVKTESKVSDNENASDVVVQNQMSEKTINENTFESEPNISELSFKRDIPIFLTNENVKWLDISAFGDGAFPSGSLIEMNSIQPNSFNMYLNDLNQMLMKNAETATPVFPIDIKILDKTGKTLSDFHDKVKIQIHVEDLDPLKDTQLYHGKYDENGILDKWEVLEYSTAKATDSEKAYVEFETNSFSPFIFATVEKSVTKSDAEPDAKSTDISPVEGNDKSEKDAFEKNSTSTNPEKGDEPIANTQKRGAPLLGATAPKQIRLTVVDRDGNTLSAEELGDGFDLYYYEGPANGYQPGYGGSEGYAGSIHISSPTALYTVNMEDGASADTPYLLQFDSDSADYYTNYGNTTNVHYMCISGVTYDGTDIIYGRSGRMGETIDVSSSVVELKIYKINKVTPRFKVKLTGGDDATDAYPALIRLFQSGMMGPGPTSLEPIAEQNISADGVVTLQSTIETSVTADIFPYMGNNVPVQVSDGVEIEISNDSMTGMWSYTGDLFVPPMPYMSQSAYFPLSIDDSGACYAVFYDGTTYSLDSEESVFEFSYVSVTKIKVNVNVVDTEGQLVSASDIEGDNLALQFYDRDVAQSIYTYPYTQAVLSPSSALYHSMNSAATADNTYRLIIGSYSYRPDYIFPNIEIIYDGQNILSANDLTTPSPTPHEFNGNELTVTIVKLDYVKPQIRINFNSDGQDMYPTTAQGEIQYNSGGYSGNINASQTASADGTIVINGEAKYPVGANINVSLGFTEENENYEWRWQNCPDNSQNNQTENQVVLRLDGEGKFHAVDTSGNEPVVAEEEYVFEYKARPANTVDAGIKIRLTDDENASISSDWPAYVKVKIGPPTGSAYSHTFNITDDGTQTGYYGNNGTNRDIRGTGRSSGSYDAHVISFPGAPSLNVDIIYATESVYCDWVCMWSGSHPNYTASNNSGSSITGKLGGSRTSQHYEVTGDTVTFGWYSDSSVYSYYGYYAVVTPTNASTDSESLFETVVPVQQDAEGTYIQVPNLDALEKLSVYNVEIVPCSDTEGTQPNNNWNSYNSNVSPVEIANLSVTLPYAKSKLDFDLITDSNVNVDLVYPVYVKVNAYKNGTLDNSTVVRSDENGTIPISMLVSKKENWESISSRYLEITPYKDENCTEVYQDWMANVASIPLGVNDGQFVTYGNQGNSVPFTSYALKIRGTNTITVPMTTVVTDAGLLSNVFPIHMVATLSNAQTIDRIINSVADLNEDLVFTAQEGHFDTASSYDFDVAFYNDTENFDPTTAELSDHVMLGRIQGYARLSDNLNLISAYGRDQIIAVQLAQIKANVNPQPYTEEISETHPVRFSMVLEEQYSSGIYNDIPTVQRTENGQFVYVTNILAPIGYEANVTTKPVFDDVIKTWAPDNNYGRVNSEGLLCDYREQPITLLPYEIVSENSVPVSIPVHMNVPNNVEHPYLFENTQQGLEAVHVILLKKQIDGTSSAVSHNAYNSYDNYSTSYENHGDSYCYTNITSLNDNAGSVAVGMHNPGEYYVVSYVGEYYSYISDNNFDVQWKQNLNPVKVTVQNDGAVVDENGNPYVAEFTFIEEYYDLDKPLVIPTLDIETTLPENYDYTYSANTSKDKYTPQGYSLSITPTWNHYSSKFVTSTDFNFRDATDRNNYSHSGSGYTKYQRIPNGRSQLGTAQEWYDWYVWLHNHPSTSTGVDTSGYEGTPTVGIISSGNSGSQGHSYFYGSTAYNYIQPQGVPVGDYVLSYSNPFYIKNWFEDTVRVHLAEDGHYYKIKDDGTYETTPYLVEFRMLNDDELQGDVVATYSSLDVNVHTYGHANVSMDNAFPEGNMFNVLLSERNYAAGTYSIIATGKASITETGDSTVTLTSIIDGAPITIRENNSYTLEYSTQRSNGNLDYDWISNSSWGNLNSGDGTPRENFENFINAPLQNEYLVMPWKTVSPQKAERTGTTGLISFKPLTSTSQFEEKSNYIIVTYNNYDGCLYALAYDENGGHQIKLYDADEVAELGDLSNLEYVVSETDDIANYVLQANKVKLAEGSTSLQFKTNVKEGGKTVAVKLGQSSTVLDPLFDSSAGTLMVEDVNPGEFSIWKGRYARLQYLPEMFGYSGFSVQGLYNGSHGNYPTVYPDMNFTNDEGIAILSPGAGMYPQDDQLYRGEQRGFTSYYTTWYNGGYPSLYGATAGLTSSRAYRYDIPAQYLTNAYVSGLQASYNPIMPVYTTFMILSDNVPEPSEPDITNDYTLVKTFGDFVQTFIQNNNNTYAADMVLVWTDGKGNEWTLNPSGLKQARSEPTSGNYRKISVGADNEMIPNNNSGTSSRFGFEVTDVDGTLEMVFANPYALRKSRQNTDETKDYLTLTADSAWTRADDAAHGSGLVYVLKPTSTVRSISDYDAEQSYTLQVIRDGTTSYLGVETDDNGKLQMTTVTSSSDAIQFKIYSDNLKRYYSSAYGSDLYRYYRITNLDDINEYDELLIVYNDNGTKRIVSTAYMDSGISTQYNNYIPAAVEVLPEYSTVDSRDASYPDNAIYKWRYSTDEYVKKPYAYIDSEDTNVIWAQGVTANALSDFKGAPSSSARKFNNAVSLGRDNYIYIKTGFGAYSDKTAEISFRKSDVSGEFYLRGGKSDAWLGTGTYNKQYLRLDYGTYVQGDPHLLFQTVDTDDRASFEIYRRSTTNETFRVAYHDTDDEIEATEIKPKESFVLTQKMDETINDTEYIFVGWSTDSNHAGYLGLEDSSNLFDYDDIANKASITAATKTKYSLLGNCTPDGSGHIDFSEVENLLDNEDVLHVYPVYAIKGYSSAISANEGDQMIIGASDFKDMEMGGDGTHSERERWLGSINIEVYKDGELWVPGAGGTTIGRKSGGSTTATLYFAYHNDNAADLNIKFIADDVTAATLYDYMSNGEFTQTEPSANYLIDAVWAEQGGSEDGLKYRYNWMSPEYGGQLDNVKGGSTVKIYVTTKYQVKYYLDKKDGNGYQLLAGDEWTDTGFYTTPGTENAVDALIQTCTYEIEPDGDYPNLINQTPNISTTFKDENIQRGGYSQFLYKFEDTGHVFTTAELPGTDIIGDNVEFENEAWEIRNQQLGIDMTYAPETDWTMTGTSYGTGNTIYSFVGGDNDPFTEGDDYHTYHLTATVRSTSFLLPSAGVSTALLTGIALILIASTAIALEIAPKRRKRKEGKTEDVQKDSLP